MPIGVSDKQKEIWTKAKGLSEFSVADLAAFGISEETSRRYVRRWLGKGKIRIHRIGPSRTHFYAAIREVRLDGTGMPIIPTPEGNMWRSMRLLGQFSPTDLAAHSSFGGVQINQKTADAYCIDLVDAGFVTCVKKARRGVNEAHYKLVRNTGPEAPTVRRVKGVYDPNTEAFQANFTGGLPWERF